MRASSRAHEVSEGGEQTRLAGNVDSHSCGNGCPWGRTPELRALHSGRQQHSLQSGSCAVPARFTVVTSHHKRCGLNQH